MGDVRYVQVGDRVFHRGPSMAGSVVHDATVTQVNSPINVNLEVETADGRRVPANGQTYARAGSLKHGWYP